MDEMNLIVLVFQFQIYGRKRLFGLSSTNELNSHRTSDLGKVSTCALSSDQQMGLFRSKKIKTA